MPTAKVLSKSFTQFNKVMYHGTNSAHFDSLINGVDLNSCKKRTDFGKGFYLTSNFHQASKHAKNRTFRGEPLVFVYELNIAELKKYNGKIFPRMTRDWAEFVYFNRSFQNFKPHPYDYVFGGVADGRIEDLIDEIDDIPLSHTIIDYFYEKIANYATYDQLSIHNQYLFDKEIIQLRNVFEAFNREKEYIN